MAREAFTLTSGIGLTGSIGVGKSTVVASLKRRGWNVIETDELARVLVKGGQEALAEIQKEFGDAVVDADGELNRAKLAELVFKDASKRRRLEEILHPKIRERWLAEAEAAQNRGEKIAVEVPLLYEVGADKHFSKVVVIACSPELQRQRLAKRGWSHEQAESRLRAQLPQQEKIDRADHVIWNNFSIQQMDEQLDRIL